MDKVIQTEYSNLMPIDSSFLTFFVAIFQVFDIHKVIISRTTYIEIKIVLKFTLPVCNDLKCENLWLPYQKRVD